MSKSTKKLTTRIKKKTWFQVFTPKSFNSSLIGESTAMEPSDLLNRRIATNLAVLTNNFKHQHINITFVVDSIAGDKAVTKPVAFEMMTASVKRLIRRRREHIFDSFVVETKDGKAVTMKPILITRSMAPNSIVRKLRRMSRAFIADYAKKNDFETLFKDVAFGKLQKGLLDKARKVSPLRTCEIRVLKLETRKKPNVEAKELPEEKPAEEEHVDEEGEEKTEKKKPKKQETKESAVEEETAPSEEKTDDSPVEE
ncbi:hypothetical protein JXA85_08995 [Candidatus Woesearchaeota archaeon]|nr:hypothetical protein [Candidatus Woesearchaeota archaeon]